MNNGDNSHQNGQDSLLTTPPEQTIISGKVIAYLTKREDKLYKRMRGLTKVTLIIELDDFGQPASCAVLKRETL